MAYGKIDPVLADMAKQNQRDRDKLDQRLENIQKNLDKAQRDLDGLRKPSQTVQNTDLEPEIIDAQKPAEPEGAA